MNFYTEYSSPVGKLTLVSDGEALTGLWIESQKHFMYKVSGFIEEANDLEVFSICKRWLSRYFVGEHVTAQNLPMRPQGSKFQQEVWQQLLTIPYGQTRTYGEIAQAIGCKSAQAVGGAVGKNPISIIIPCHRVMGKDGSLTGYDGGIEKKQILLSIEKSHPG